MTFSKQPVAWITATVLILNIVKDVLTHNIDIGTAVNSAIIALGGVITWHKVSPVSKREDVY